MAHEEKEKIIIHIDFATGKWRGYLCGVRLTLSGVQKFIARGEPYVFLGVNQKWLEEVKE